MSPADPYSIAGAVYLPPEGDGDVRFNDGQAFAFRTRIDTRGFRRIRLLTLDHGTPVSSTRREASLRAWLDERYPVGEQPELREPGR
jgi:hypothetical protein